MKNSVLLPVTFLFCNAFVTATSGNDSLPEVAWRTSNTRVVRLVEAMTPEEKVLLLHGQYYGGTQDFAGFQASIPRLSIPAVESADGEA